LMSCAHIANRRLSRIIGASFWAASIAGCHAESDSNPLRYGAMIRAPNPPLLTTGRGLPPGTEQSGANDRNDSYQKTKRLAAWFGASINQENKPCRHR